MARNVFFFQRHVLWLKFLPIRTGSVVLRLVLTMHEDSQKYNLEGDFFRYSIDECEESR
jgi:hypothetical protein